MAVITLKISHLCTFTFTLLILHTATHVIDTIPLCGSMDGSAPKDSDKIVFKDNQGIRTVEVNGTVVACYPDGTPVNMNSSSSSSSSDEEEVLRGAKLVSRIREVFLIPKPIENRNHTETVPNRRYVPNVRQCARSNQTFCTEDNTYPTEHIEQLLRKYWQKYADVFGSDELAPIVSPRIDAIDEVFLCGSYEQVIYPTSGTRHDGTEGYIFNTPQHPQGIRVSMCSNLGKPCNLSDQFPNGYRTECKQQVVYRELLSLSPEGRPVKDKFEFPACCSCAVYKV